MRSIIRGGFVGLVFNMSLYSFSFISVKLVVSIFIGGGKHSTIDHKITFIFNQFTTILQ